MLPAIKKILYCTDLSGNSAAAFRHAVALAKIADADVHVLHVIERLSEDAVITLQAFLQDPEKRKAAISERKNLAEKMLIERQEKFWAGLSAEEQNLRTYIKSVEVVESYPAETILKKADELGCDMIIMGGHNRGLSHNFLGSVAKSVLRRSRVPSMIIPLPSV